MKSNLLRVSRHSISEDDKKAVLRALESGTIARGKEIRAFEEEFACYVGAKHAVACSSGTAALHLACMATGELFNNKLINVPTVTFAATANAPKMCGSLVGFYDNMDPSIRGHQHIIIHFAGSAYHIHDAFIEDACHALGASYDGEPASEVKRIGSCPESAMTCFSFHPTKHITTGEGGMVTTNDEGYAKELRRLKSNGIDRPASDLPWEYSWSSLGLNYEMSEISAALGRSQLENIRNSLEGRRKIGREYFHRLPGSAKPVLEAEHWLHDSFHIFPVRIDFRAVGKTRSQVMFELLKRGIETQVHYKPLHLHPMGGGRRGDLPHAEAYYDQALSLPIHCEMTPEDAVYVCEALEEVLG